MRSIKLEKISHNKQPTIQLSDLKHYLRIDNDAEDALLSELLKTAESELESQTFKTLLAADWCLRVIHFSGNYLNINRENVRRIHSIKVMKDGMMTELDRKLYTYSKGVMWFHHAVCTKCLEIIFSAGHIKAELIEPEIITTLKQRIACLYENKTHQPNLFSRFREIRI